LKLSSCDICFWYSNISLLHEITEILLKVAFNTIPLPPKTISELATSQTCEKLEMEKTLNREIFSGKENTEKSDISYF
jgi:hypothetical protein